MIFDTSAAPFCALRSGGHSDAAIRMRLSRVTIILNRAVCSMISMVSFDLRWYRLVHLRWYKLAHLRFRLVQVTFHQHIWGFLKIGCSSRATAVIGCCAIVVPVAVVIALVVLLLVAVGNI